MTRDKFNSLLRELGLSMFWREEFLPYPNIRVFCREGQRFLVEDFMYHYLPAYVSMEIITERHDYRAYTPPKSTISDHLRDCFGWLTC